LQYDSSDSLSKKFSNLKQTLNKVEDLKLLQPDEFIAPFLEAIRSEEVPGVITSIALSSVNKFLSYGLIGMKH
jgi:golgi-specific brefeldin A-resistance guanine nucleotide exchange factor 1